MPVKSQSQRDFTAMIKRIDDVIHLIKQLSVPKIVPEDVPTSSSILEIPQDEVQHIHNLCVAINVVIETIQPIPVEEKPLVFKVNMIEIIFPISIEDKKVS